MNKIVGFLFGLVLAIPTVALAGRVYDHTIESVRRGSGGYVYRWDDPDFQVKCWEMKDGYAGGLSCLPWPEVKER